MIKENKNKAMNTQPLNPEQFPTLVRYDRQQIEEAVQKLIETQGTNREMALMNLEMDLAEQEQLATGGE